MKKTKKNIQIEENATMSKSKRKRLNKKKNMQEEAKEDDFEVNVKDPRFTALFTSHHFNIDPADPHYRKTKGTEALINEKLKRRARNEVHTENVSERFYFINSDLYIFSYNAYRNNFRTNNLKSQKQMENCQQNYKL